LVLIGSLSSLTDSNYWWIRIWDFPRSQLLIVMLVLAVLLSVFDRAWRPWFSVVLVLAACWQLYRIHPYTRLAKTEVASATSADAEKPGCFKVLTLNVYQANRDYARTLELLERKDADVLVLLETDTQWHDALAPLLSRYPHVLKRPLDNTYGLIFASRLPTEGARLLGAVPTRRFRRPWSGWAGRSTIST
jgi:endonuclease/exonuclease/phosphatase (EEP) superfamily protein YafD